MYKRQDQVPDLCGLARLDQLGLGGLGAGVGQVGADRVVEEVGVLGDDADGVAQRVEGDVAQVPAVDAYGAVDGVVQPRHQVGGGGLAAAGGADEGGELPGGRAEAEFAQHFGGLLRAFAAAQRGRFERGERHFAGPGVTEGDPVELDLRRRAAARCGEAPRAGPLLDERLEIEQLEHPVEADEGGQHVGLHAGQLGDRPVQPAQQGGQRHQGADPERAVDHEASAEAVDDRGGEGGEQQHERGRHAAVDGPGHADVADPDRPLLELGRFLPRPAEELRQHRARHVEAFVDGDAQLGVHLHLFPGVALEASADQRHRHEEHRQHRQGDEAQEPREVEHLADDQEQGQRAGGGGQQHAERVLRHDDVGVQPADEGPGLGPGEERQRLSLHVVERLDAQVVADALADASRDVALPELRDGGQQGEPGDDGRDACHQPHVVLEDSVVDHHFEQQRHGHDGERVDHGEQQQEDHVAAVRFRVGEHPAQGARPDALPGHGVLRVVGGADDSARTNGDIHIGGTS